MNESRSFQKLDISHAQAVFSIVNAAVAGMRLAGIDQWDEIYPTFEILESDIASGSSYGAFQENRLIGYVCLNETQSDEYLPISWRAPDRKVLIIHRLCASPETGLVGIGQYLLESAETFAQENGYLSIRLDSFSQNPRALNLYERNYYSIQGLVRFRKGDFFVYEKRFDPTAHRQSFGVSGKFWASCLRFARHKTEVLAVLLVGSRARGTYRQDSDIDLLIITSDKNIMVDETSWVVDFGEVQFVRIEHWGEVTSVRVNMPPEGEIEFSIANRSWLRKPLDAGTRRVLSDGYIVMFQRQNSLEPLKGEVEEVLA